MAVANLRVFFAIVNENKSIIVTNFFLWLIMIPISIADGIFDTIQFWPK